MGDVGLASSSRVSLEPFDGSSCSITILKNWTKMTLICQSSRLLQQLQLQLGTGKWQQQAGSRHQGGSVHARHKVLRGLLRKGGGRAPAWRGGPRAPPATTKWWTGQRRSRGACGPGRHHSTPAGCMHGG